MTKRQPVHTLYGGAHLYNHGTTAKMGAIARRAWDEFGPIGQQPERIWQKLCTEPVEDLRIDFEDGYGVRTDDEEDRHAEEAARQLSDPAEPLPPFIGVRIRSFGGETRKRAERTLGIVVDHLVNVPANFAVTLPKIESPDEVHALASRLPESIVIEAMIETPAILPHLRELPAAAGGRLRSAHFGPYDFTSSCGILSVDQDLHHPLCDAARQQMLLAFAGSGVTVADGPTATLPLGRDRSAVLAAWDLHRANIRRSIRMGFFQSWDLHPAQLPARYAAVFDVYHENAAPAAARLRNFMARSQQATSLGTAFDDQATVLGYRIFFERAKLCGALTEEEIAELVSAQKG